MVYSPDVAKCPQSVFWSKCRLHCDNNNVREALFRIFPVSAQRGTDLPFRLEQIAKQQIHLYRTNQTFAEEFDKAFPSYPDHETVKETFPCQKLSPSPTVPTSVHSLRPADVKVMGALGDSLTAGRGAAGGIIGLLIDYRGLSWSIGGDDSFSDLQLLPNIVREYNPDLYGYAKGIGTSKERFSVAVTGATSHEILEQAENLVKRMKENKDIDINNDWKVVTLMIGGNDLCDYCKDETKYSIENYKNNLQTTLDYLHANLPRTFVNLVEVLNVEIVRELSDNLFCSALHIYTCDCAANPKSKAAEDELLRLRNGYQVAARELAASGRYDTKEDFTVVLQPFYRDTFLPRTDKGEVDMSYFASDCFHHSKKGQNAAAEALWNNMIEPVGSKRLNWTPEEALLCPTETAPFLYTSKNSNATKGFFQ